MARVVHGCTEVLSLKVWLGCKVGWQRMLMCWDSNRLALSIVLRLLANLELRPSGAVVSTPSVHAAVPPILDGVVTTTTQSPGNLSPALAHLANHLLDHDAFLWRDGLMIEIRLEVLVESFPALLG